MKKVWLVMSLWLAGAFAAAQAQDVDQSNPYEMVREVASVTFDRMKNNEQQIKKNPEMLRTIMEEELLPYIDYQFSAFMVLGKHFKSVPKEKLAEYVQVFRQYLITTYAVAMGYYDNQTVEFEPQVETDDQKSVTVRAVVKDDTRPDIKIAFKVRKDSRTNEWKAYDMVAEGISMLNSKRSEFETILRQEGIDSVIKLMKEKIKQPIELNKQKDAA